MKKTLFATTFTLFVMLNAVAQKSAVFAPDGKAIKGYDPVAFLPNPAL